MEHLPLFSEDYLFSRWEDDFAAYRDSGADSGLRTLLRHWADRDASLTETQLEAQFVDRFFKQIWQYWGTGERDRSEGFCLNFQYGVDGAGQAGGKGAADLALGWWGFDDSPPVPQALAEFKDIRSGLDVPQRRKGNTRSPVKQCLDYLKHAFDAANLRSPVFPTWGIVTNMNEFRLYYRRTGDEFCQRFIIKAADSREISLLDDGEAALRQRFLFQKIFRRELLITKHGKNGLAALLDGQIFRERELEKGFYREYQEYREFVFGELVAANGEFAGTRGKLVRLTQRFLDRCIFILFCENMGQALAFPSDLLRDMLMRESCAPTYSGNFDNIWSLVKQLFRAMRDGGPFPPDHRINRFNGGLFEDLPELENLVIPNRVFCARGQGGSPEAIDRSRKTLLYLSARYNYGARGAARERTITLYALGRIFEQSITDLEYMEAEAEGRESLAKLTRRKRDGVYYTPEWVTGYIVRETLGTRLAEIRAELGLELGESLPSAEVAAYRKFANSKGRKAARAALGMLERLKRLDAYERAMNALKVLDPACGSGAFLIQALRFLLREQRAIAEERERITGAKSLFDSDAVMRSILARNLYGVDINPESVEITQLALWLHTALPGKPLSNLEHHLRCGNSLIGPEFEAFYQLKHPQSLFADLAEQERENVNVFDWEKAFPEALGDKVPVEKRGFDCVFGNPPYVKLQHFRTLKPDESDFYLESREAGRTPRYASARTGSFDLYLLFIEKGVSLLNDAGRMGFIAPSLWLKNEYGQGLREWVKRTGSLDRWIDFKSFQVFEEATTYTALQFFSRKPNAAIRFFFAPDGDIAPVDWNSPAETLNYDELPDDAAWNLIRRRERELIARLSDACLRLDDDSVTRQIFQGLITSADSIYHLCRVKPGKYAQIGGKGDGKEYEIEDAIMHPLVSGPEAKRYQLPDTGVYLLFPYSVDKNAAELFDEKEMAGRFPKAWAYLRKHEKRLRSRERNSFNDAQWYRFGRNQNLDKQELAKLGVAQTVPGMRVFADEKGTYYFNNVRVNGILPKHKNDLYFLLGVLNSPVVDFVFKRIAKPKDNAYFEANKQYIAPLPIPRASAAEKGRIGRQARKLQALHTTRRDKIARLRRRLGADQCVDDHREPKWLWADVKTIAEWKAIASEHLSARERMAWAKAEFERRLDARLQPIDSALVAGAALSVAADAGEIRFLADSVPLVSAYAGKDEGLLIAAQWRQIARTTKVTECFSAKRLTESLLSLRRTGQQALRRQIIQIDSEIQSLEQQIAAAESELNTAAYRLYKLSPEEIRLVEEI